MPEPKTEIDYSAPAIGYSCFRCEQPGHSYKTCKRPGAKTRQELDSRINRYIERWDAGYGVISTAQKTAWIAAEWKAFHAKEKAK
jgi:hypothetical protein